MLFQPPSLATHASRCPLLLQSPTTVLLKAGSNSSLVAAVSPGSMFAVDVAGASEEERGAGVCVCMRCTPVR